MMIHSLAPLISENRDGSTAGIITSTMPTRPSVYAYRETARWSRTMMSSPAASTTAMSVQASCRPPTPEKMGRLARSLASANARSMRRRNATPSPLSRATAGTIAGSA
jgi:hypothetical protein